MKRLARLLAIVGLYGAALGAAEADTSITNVSYDPTRELYKKIDPLFVADWKAKTGENARVTSVHGGSGAQAKAVIEGLDADVVSLALAYDVDLIAIKTGKLAANWQTKFPNNSSPYTSTVIFLVRKGNPKNIRDWDDLAKSDVSVVTPSPKTSGGARWNYLAAWSYGLKKFGGDEWKTKDFVRGIYRNAAVLDKGARSATLSFTKRETGDVLIAWENEALLLASMRPDKFEVVVPSLSIRAEPAVAIIDRNVDNKGTRKVAEAYLNFLYTAQAQKVIAENFYRPANVASIPPESLKPFVNIEMVTIDQAFGGWAAAHKKHFSPGGTFEEIELRNASSAR
ncbi:sulfate ABC transporter substrate-binding protein [Methylocystis parvus]|uniref:Sulfate ABC transporter substrate-binding protein n=1 Tax=Methylocystis parvus TaxID=134 RepID=A0A6B8M4V0_9HYPH|nr:sulfate ABC transporter substrate-binding protein [Methylocystis parvus]QGM97408.1 sulfate ABC transporter substrate-binding protein [Methylocystis parvus]WBJ98679.1 sulfate ABC transporter substrate-binding protein [Methylocystis parvus OBBP]